ANHCCPRRVAPTSPSPARDRRACDTSAPIALVRWKYRSPVDKAATTPSTARRLPPDVARHRHLPAELQAVAWPRNSWDDPLTRTVTLPHRGDHQECPPNLPRCQNHEPVAQ